ncbi:hypothetical protein BaRGS_00000049 [Batillaria attramentaria]|uniref:Uncharacterized protein n=1 Tax=Batillaria attramentaria TaxID=370345 RepID=A0ABD0MAH6_9CAEN
MCNWPRLRAKFQADELKQNVPGRRRAVTFSISRLSDTVRVSENISYGALLTFLLRAVSGVPDSDRTPKEIMNEHLCPLDNSLRKCSHSPYNILSNTSSSCSLHFMFSAHVVCYAGSLKEKRRRLASAQSPCEDGK